MKKVLLLICILISLSTIMYVIFAGANSSQLTKDEALKIGEEKYLEFLWIVDGAFNNERLDGEYIVNGQKLNNKEFTCTYKNNTICVGKNFEETFHRLFCSSITYKDVYSDLDSYSWITYENDEYLFNNLNTCGINRMNLNQKMEIKEISNDKLSFYVYSDDEKHKEFILIKEDDNWKISKAYYHDLCEIRYNIG